MKLNVKCQRTDALSLSHRRERKEIHVSTVTLKEIAKTFSLMENPHLYRFTRLYNFSQNFLWKDPKSLPSPYVFHIQHKLKLPREKTEQTSI